MSQDRDDNDVASGTSGPAADPERNGSKAAVTPTDKDQSAEADSVLSVDDEGPRSDPAAQDVLERLESSDGSEADELREEAARRPVGVAPVGKSGRGGTATVARTVRRDADQPEDTSSSSVNPFTFIKQVVEELRKVIWPTRDQMVTYTIVVFLFLIFMTFVVAGVDFGAGKLVELIFDA